MCRLLSLCFREARSNLRVELTFIILANEPAINATTCIDSDRLKTLPMVGDVNLFLKGDPSDEDFEAEVEIMIAGESRTVHCGHGV